MKIHVDQIKTEESERVRKELGNLEPLEQSIAKVGLINPILIDEEGNLIAGYRRLQACKNLGMKEVDVKTVDFGDDQLKKFEVEIAENFYRKDFTTEEILATEVKRQHILESRRRKGFWEKIWLWLKGLFTPPKNEEETDLVRERKAPLPAADIEENDDMKKRHVVEQAPVGQDARVEKGATSEQPERTDQSAKEAGREKDLETEDRHSIKWRSP